MRYDFATIQDEQSYASIPEGRYQVRVVEVRPGLARDGSVRWGMRLEVAQGDLAGRVACFDSLTWSDRGVLRVKLVLEALGFDVSGTIEIEPDQLIGRLAQAEVVRETWEDENGIRQTRNTVPYRGWSALDGDDEPAQPFEPGPRETPF